MVLKDINRTGDQLQASVEQRFGRLCRNCGRNLSSDVKLNFLFLRKDIKLHLALLQQHSNLAHSYFLCLVIGPSSQGRGQIVFGGFFPGKGVNPRIGEKKLPKNLAQLEVTPPHLYEKRTTLSPENFHPQDESCSCIALKRVKIIPIRA